MRSRLTLNLALITLASFASASAVAATCALNQDQEGFLSEAGIQLEIAVGEVPKIQRCDTNDDQKVDINDIRAISLKRNQPVAHPDDPMDWDKDGVINLLDARGCQRLCSEPRCAVNNEPPAPDAPPAGVQDDAQCVQAFTDDENQVEQLIAVSENAPVVEGQVPAARKLGVVVMQRVDGQVKLIKDSYAGRTKEGTVDLHLSRQPAGTVNLAPGTVVLTKPATVAYQNGKPKTLYYVEDGKLRRAAFGVDD